MPYLEEHIQHKTYPEFVQRIKKAITEFPIETIDEIIGSMHNGMLEIVERTDQRIHSELYMIFLWLIYVMLHASQS